MLSIAVLIKYILIIWFSAFGFQLGFVYSALHLHHLICPIIVSFYFFKTKYIRLCFVWLLILSRSLYCTYNISIINPQSSENCTLFPFVFSICRRVYSIVNVTGSASCLLYWMCLKPKRMFILIQFECWTRFSLVWGSSMSTVELILALWHPTSIISIGSV